MLLLGRNLACCLVNIETIMQESLSWLPGEDNINKLGLGSE